MDLHSSKFMSVCVFYYVLAYLSNQSLLFSWELRSWYRDRKKKSYNNGVLMLVLLRFVLR